MKKSLLTNALKLARDELPNHPQLEHWPHWSFIVQRNSIVEWATNTAGSPPIHHGYHSRVNDKNFRPKTHSEFACYRKAKGILNHNTKFEIINIRLNKRGDMRLSKPCVCCASILRELGCCKFYYSYELGFLSS